ncbi:hypothetical protein G6F58_013588 [Rhizopus delemar]|nr:hypothetical protein G6F58_013588 [Rhizopus delemar]
MPAQPITVHRNGRESELSRMPLSAWRLASIASWSPLPVQATSSFCTRLPALPTSQAILSTPFSVHRPVRKP